MDLETLDLEVEGYRLRRFRPNDAASLQRHADDPEVAARLRDGFPSPYSEADAAAFLARVATDADHAIFAIAGPGDAVVGGIGLTRGEDVHRRTAELGYWLGRAHWNRGVVSAAVRAITAFAFEHTDLVRIHAEPFLPHPASERVLEKAGYARESVQRAAAVKHGRLLDQAVWVRLRDDVGRCPSDAPPARSATGPPRPSPRR